jgi:hypothetical protein
VKKARRYAEGGYADTEDSAFDMPAPKESMAEAAQLVAPEKEEKSETFKEAFAKARRAGDKTFDWKGKTYSTKAAGESKSETKPTAPAERKSAASTESKPATRTTSFPPGSLAGKIARSQGAASDFPEPTNSSVGEKSARQRQETMDMFSRMGKKFQRYMGTQETRDRLKAEGYAKGGMTASKRADGIAQRGKTRGKVY